MVQLSLGWVCFGWVCCILWPEVCALVKGVLRQACGNLNVGARAIGTSGENSAKEECCCDSRRNSAILLKKGENMKFCDTLVFSTTPKKSDRDIFLFIYSSSSFLSDLKAYLWWGEWASDWTYSHGDCVFFCGLAWMCAQKQSNSAGIRSKAS